MASLGVNIDHIANVRQARRAVEPDPVTMALLAELGGAVHSPPFAVPGVGEIAIIGDPQGAALGLIQPDMSGGGVGG